MSDIHGLILADHKEPRLGELVSQRTCASLPFCGRYRLIDFSLSAMQNAGVRDVGVIMQRDYQSLLDHIGSGKDWDMSRKSGGLRLLPPFGQPEDKTGEYATVIDALWAVSEYIRDIKQDYVVLGRGNLAGNIDLNAAMERHLDSGADVTAICADTAPSSTHHRFIADADGAVRRIVYKCHGAGAGLASLEVFILSKATLLGIMERCTDCRSPKFHRDGLGGLLAEGGRIGVYEHKGYARHITSVAEYYDASMDMLDAAKRSELFPKERPLRTKVRSDVSTYYGESASSKNSLVADGCFIEGSIENCILFRGVRVHKDAVLKNCIVMQDTDVGGNSGLSYVISDKEAIISPYITLAGSPRLPLVLPKQCQI